MLLDVELDESANLGDGVELVQEEPLVLEHSPPRIDHRIGEADPCPCGSGLRLGRCHNVRLNRLRKLGSRSWFRFIYAELATQLDREHAAPSRSRMASGTVGRPAPGAMRPPAGSQMNVQLSLGARSQGAEARAGSVRRGVAPPRGLEPRTSRLEISRSIQLSYGGVLFSRRIYPRPRGEGTTGPVPRTHRELNPS